MTTASRWRRTLSDAVFLYLLPVTIGLLPWRWGFALLRCLANSELGFGDVVEASWRQAKAGFPQLERARFCHDYRLLLLVDRCDAVLCLLRGARWWLRRVDVIGDALTDLRPGVMMFSHWGSGNWIWRVLAAHGLPAHLVARPAGIGDVGRSWLARGYVPLRAWAIRHSACRSIIFVGGSAPRLRRVLESGQTVLGAADQVTAPGQRSVPVRLLGRQMHFPTGLPWLAGTAAVPLTILAFGLDPTTGRRQLFVETLPDGFSMEEIVQRYAAFLEQRIRDQPALWLAWPWLADQPAVADVPVAGTADGHAAGPGETLAGQSRSRQ